VAVLTVRTRFVGSGMFDLLWRLSFLVLDLLLLDLLVKTTGWSFVFFGRARIYAVQLERVLDNGHLLKFRWVATFRNFGVVNRGEK